MATPITNLAELQAMNDDLTDDYILSNDIDASATQGVDWGEGGGVGFKPIGTNVAPFTGSLDGNGKVISGLYINRPTTNYVGLFGDISTGSVADLGVTDCDITGKDYVGSLAGYTGTGTFNDCYSTGAVSGVNYVGGFCGRGGTCINCYSECTVVGTTNYVGGFGGNAGTYVNCHASGTVSGANYVGGFLGVRPAIITTTI